MWRPALDPSAPSRHVALLRALERDIASGRLTPGARLPTHRDLADALGISVGTVTRAYREAEARGLTHGEVGRGSFVGPGPSPGPAVGGRTVSGGIDMATLWPLYGLDPDPAPALRRLAQRPDLLQYQPHAGMLHHRAAGAAWSGHCGLSTSPDRVVVCAGIQHAIFVILASVCEPGDVVLSDALTYPGVRAAAGLLRLRVHGLPMDDQGLLPDSFAAACRQRRPKALYVMPTIQNPTTGIMSAKRRKEIAAVAVKHGVAIIEDDVHRLFAPDAAEPLATFAPEVSYFIAAFSKTVTSGLRVAFVVAPPAAADRLATTVAATTWMTSPLPTEVATQWIGDGTAAATARQKRLEAARRQALARKVLAGLPVRSPLSSYHLWLTLSPPWTGRTFSEEAQRAGVAVAPAELFATTPESTVAAVRISISGAPDHSTLKKGLETLRALASRAPGVALV